MGKQWKQWLTIFLGSKITGYGDCTHEIKRHLLLGRKAMTNLDSIFKTRDITLPTKVCLVKAMVFPVVMYGCESWILKQAEHWRIDAFELWCWRRLLKVPWTARRSNQSILKEINPEYSLGGLMLKLKLRYFGHLMQRTDSLEKTLILRKIEGRRRRGWQRMRRLDGITNSWSLFKLMSIESVMPSNLLILCRPLFLPLSIFPSIRVFSNESALHITWPKYWSLSFSISPSNGYPGLISFRIDWFELLAVQGTQESSQAPQFEITNSLALSLLNGPTLTSVRDHWKNHSFDYMDFCWQSDVSAF